MEDTYSLLLLDAFANRALRLVEQNHSIKLVTGLLLRRGVTSIEISGMFITLAPFKVVLDQIISRSADGHIGKLVCLAVTRFAQAIENDQNLRDIARELETRSVPHIPLPSITLTFGYADA